MPGRRKGRLAPQTGGDAGPHEDSKAGIAVEMAQPNDVGEASRRTPGLVAGLRLSR
jgi:hypothetical protein